MSEGAKVNIHLGNRETGWIPSEVGVRQGDPCSPIQFNIYLRELSYSVRESKITVV